MKQTLLLTALFSFSTLLSAAETALVVLARQHADLSETMPERPYGEDDTSYGLFVDLFDGPGAWRLGASYSDSLDGLEGVESVITPEIGLLVVDGNWETGISVLVDYVETEDDSDWGDVYFQYGFGLNLGLTSGMSVGLHASYPFEDLEDISDFSTGDIEYAATVRLRF